MKNVYTGPKFSFISI